MELSSISGSNFQTTMANQTPPPPKKLSTDPLSEEQQTQLEEILSQYDSSSVTPDVMEEIFSEMQEAGIPMSEDSAAILEAQGFGPPEKPSGPPPAGGPQPSGGTQGVDSQALAALDSETKDTLTSLIESLLSGSIEQSDFDEEVEGLGLEDLIGNLFDEKA